MSERCHVRIEPDRLGHPLMRIVFLDGCAHRVSLQDGNPFTRSDGRTVLRHPAPAVSFLEFAKHEHFVFCLNGPFLPELEQIAVKRRLFALPGTRREAA